MRNKIATMVGSAIGDALGQPFEFCNSEQIKNSGWQGDFIDGDVWKLKAGQYTDDTLMMICLGESLIEQNKFDAEAVAQKYIEWVASGDLRGIGVTCERAISNMAAGIPLTDCGKKGAGMVKPSVKRINQSAEDMCGNGTIMRVAPIGIFFRNDHSAMLDAVRQDANMTHNFADARDGNKVLTLTLATLALGKTKLKELAKNNGPGPELSVKNIALDQTLSFLPFDGSNVVNHLWIVNNLLNQDVTLDEVGEMLGTSGAAHCTLASSMYCFLKYPSFEEAVVNAVLMGGDTDTRGAIVGALAGTYYGLDGIPEKYHTVEDFIKLRAMDELLFEGPTQ